MPEETTTELGPPTALDEIKKSISATLYDRISDPLLGSYVLAFLLWNWRALSVLIWGQGTIEIRILWVAAVYDFPTGIPGDTVCARALALTGTVVPPLLLAIAFVLAQPVVGRLFTIYKEREYVKTLNARNIERGRRLLTAEESGQLADELETALAEVSSLRAQVAGRLAYNEIGRYALLGAALERESQVTHFRIARTSLTESGTIRIGEWVRYSHQVEPFIARIRGKQPPFQSTAEGFALVLAIFEGGLYLVQVSGLVRHHADMQMIQSRREGVGLVIDETGSIAEIDMTSTGIAPAHPALIGHWIDRETFALAVTFSTEGGKIMRTPGTAPG
jgi:hypothetical protein